MKHLEGKISVLNGPHSYTKKVSIPVQYIIGMSISMYLSVVYKHKRLYLPKLNCTSAAYLFCESLFLIHHGIYHNLFVCP